MRSAFGQEFDVPDGYLNTASIGVPPRTAVVALRRTVDTWALGGAQPGDFDESVAAARAAFGRLVGAPTGHVSIGGSASALVGLVAASVPDGTRVVTAHDEFTSTTFPFAAQHARGVTVTEVPLDRVADAAAGADLVAVSVVQSSDGRVADLAALREVAAAGTIVVLDATQALGWLPLDVGWADAVVAGGYKWLLCPRGAAWMSTSARLRDTLVPQAANWYAGQQPWQSIYGLPLRLAHDARRLDTSPAWWCHVGAAHTLPWLGSLDARLVHDHCVGLADAFLGGLGLPPQGSAIVSVDVPDALARLTAAGVTGSSRGGRTRLAFHLYSDATDVSTALGALR
ncbi:MAG: aminotransferase class V-fold PLP-dependent enzyme [Actinomycetota bacterium]|nr:aminotransferase class V-fold PLP-dependent enzyme [Actinomycetota bacterium]